MRRRGGIRGSITVDVDVDIADVLEELDEGDLARGLLDACCGDKFVAIKHIDAAEHNDKKDQGSPWLKVDPTKDAKEAMSRALDALDRGDVGAARHILACEIVPGADVAEYERAKAGKHPFLVVHK